MGQATEKAKLRLASMGYGPLPITYQLDEQSVIKDQASGRKLKKYTVVLNPGEVEVFIDHLQFRSMHPQYLIQVQFVEAKKEELDYCKLFVYLEQISLSLQEIVCTHFLNMIKMLYSALHGFKALYAKHGYFTVESCMIGLNYQNTPKSWLSRKYTSHSPKNSYSFQKAAKGEESMVLELKEIFFCKVDKMTLPNAFKFEANNFQGMIGELKDKFGEELLNSKVDLSQRFTQEVDKPILNSVKSSSVLTNPSGTQIRFNYHKAGTQNRSNINISFNNKPIVQPQSINKSDRISLEKPKINFSYKKDSTPVASLNSSLGASVKQLQRTNYASGLGNSKIIVDQKPI